MEENFWVLAIILLAIEIKISIGLPQCSLRGDGKLFFKKYLVSECL